jgi:hypothetical protein
VYGAEVVLPTDIMHDAPRVVLYIQRKRIKKPERMMLICWKKQESKHYLELQYISRTLDTIMRRR